ncbi:MAG: DUF302 domain-containing protein [candidate division WOR-3 bacterium]|nr:MAG: DUF302 domain-containing protein [candidate division WOR-3 bacterium]
MKRILGLLFVGFVLGLAAAGLCVWKLLPRFMLTTQHSRLAFEETVVAISASAIEHGWRVPKIYDLQATFIVDNYEEMTRMKIVSLYGTDNAYRMLYPDEYKITAALLPWRIAVYEAADGTVYVARLNTGVLSMFYPGTTGEMMSGAAREGERIIEDIIE